MKVIDLLVKIANGEPVPKKVRVLDKSLMPEFQIITWNENLGQYEYCNDIVFDRELDKEHLEKYIEIIEDTPEKDKKIEKLSNVTIYGATLSTLRNELQATNKRFESKLNEIIDKINGE